MERCSHISSELETFISDLASQKSVDSLDTSRSYVLKQPALLTSRSAEGFQFFCTFCLSGNNCILSKGHVEMVIFVTMWMYITFGSIDIIWFVYLQCALDRTVCWRHVCILSGMWCNCYYYSHLKQLDDLKSVDIEGLDIMQYMDINCWLPRTLIVSSFPADVIDRLQKCAGQLLLLEWCMLACVATIYPFQYLDYCSVS